MDRYNFEEHITAYIDNELSEHEKKEFEDIINSDTDCRIKFKEVKSLVNNLNELPKFKTSDNFISDLACIHNTGQIKIGSMARSERLSKYNQLIRNEDGIGKTGFVKTKYAGQDAFSFLK